MCLCSDKTVPSEAKEDIICYKIMFRVSNNTYKSIYFNKIYETGNTLYSENKFKKQVEWTDTAYCDRLGHDISVARVEDGFHSYSTFDEAEYRWRWYENKAYIIKCIIPKGSLFYMSFDGKCYCSNQIKIDSLIELVKNNILQW